MCQVAVHQSGEPHSIVSQSAKPVSAVNTVTSSPTTSASHQPCAAPTWAMPTTLATAITVAAVYAPIVASVSGGGNGGPRNPFPRKVHLIPGKGFSLGNPQKTHAAPRRTGWAGTGPG